jgi:hypothetical protein
VDSRRCGSHRSDSRHFDSSLRIPPNRSGTWKLIKEIRYQALKQKLSTSRMFLVCGGILTGAEIPRLKRHCLEPFFENTDKLELEYSWETPILNFFNIQNRGEGDIIISTTLTGRPKKLFYCRQCFRCKAIRVWLKGDTVDSQKSPEKISRKYFYLSFKSFLFNLILPIWEALYNLGPF